MLLFHGKESLDILEKSGIDIVGFVNTSSDPFDIGKLPHHVVRLAIVYKAVNNI